MVSDKAGGQGLGKHSVLVVTNMYPDADNPDFGTFVQEQVEGLRARGLPVDVLVVGGKRRKLSYVEGVRRFRRQMKEHRYDLIHAHYVFSGVVARLQWSSPLLISFHGAAEMVGWVGWLCRGLAPLADGVTVTSLEHREQLGRRDAHVIPCGVDLELFAPAPKEVALQHLGLPPGGHRVLFVGIPRPEKRLDIINQAVQLLRQDWPQAELVVATGQPHERIPDYMNACDVLVLASDHEGSPVVVKEAMACNLPIVSVDVGDVPQVIQGTEGCYICRREPTDMATKLGQALARGARTNGRAAVQRLSLESTIDSLLRIYGSLW